MSLTEQSYDYQRLERMYTYPASYQQALIHKNAHKFGYSNPKMKDGRNTPICPCCENYINTVPIPVTYTTIPNTNPNKQDIVYLLPADISLYFTFIKMVIIFVAFRFFTVDLYNIVTSLSGHYCQSILSGKGQEPGNICSSINISLLSGYNKHTNKDVFALSNLAYLNLGFTILSLLYLMAYKVFSYKLYDFLQNNDPTEDDFTVFVQNIPSIIYDKDHSKIDQCHINYEYFLRKTFEGKLQDWVRSIKKKQKNKIKFSRHQQQFYNDVYSKKNDETFDALPKIHNVTICYDLTQLENLNDKREQLAKQFIKLKGQQDKHLKESLEFIPNQIKIINSKYIQLCNTFQKDINAASALSKFVGKAFITFEYQHYKAFILRQSDKNKKFITLNNKPLKITQAPKPNDVFWQNMKLSDQQRDNNIYYSYLVMFMALAFFLLSLILLKLFQDKAKQFIKNTKANKKMATFVFNIGMIILTNVFNGVLDSHLQKLTDLQKHQSKTARMSSLIIKNVIAKFVNNVLIYFILFRLNPINPVSREGLVQKIVSLTTFSAMIKFILDLIRPNYLFKRLMNFIKYKGEQKINLFQIQLNKSIQNDEFNLASQYCYYIYMTFLVLFYSLLVPIAVPITLILFIMQYWLDKYNLFRRLSSPVDLGYMLVSLILNIFKWYVLVLSVGNLYWHLMISSKMHKVSIAIYIINIVIAIIAIVLHWLLPKHTEQKLLQKLTDKKFYAHSYSYYYKNKKFKKFYDKQNPVTGFLKKNASQNETLNITLQFIQKNNFNEFNRMTLDKVFVDLYQNTLKMQNGSSNGSSVHSQPDLTYTQKLHLNGNFQHLKKN